MKRWRIGRSACLVAIFGAGQFLLQTFLAAFFYPEGYDYFRDLEAVIARNRAPNSISAILFSMTLTMVALALIPFWMTLRSIFTESRVGRVLSTLGSISSLTNSPFIIGIALFPMDPQLDTHTLATLTVFSLFVSSTVFYSIAIMLDQNHSNYFGLVSFVLFAVSRVIFVDPLASHVAFLQTIVTCGYFVWVLLQTFLVWCWKEL